LDILESGFGFSAGEPLTELLLIGCRDKIKLLLIHDRGPEKTLG
jgi:hypothetical protein